MKQYKPSGKAVKYTMPKNKRIPLSMIRLYKLASSYSYSKKNSAYEIEEIASFLKYVFEHKNDTL